MTDRAHVALCVALVAAACSSREAPQFVRGASDCAACHAEQASAFASSPHARSDRSPVLAALLPHVERSWGAIARDRCESCHAPMHTSEDSAVTCLSCHAATGNHGTRDGDLVVDLAAPIAGPFGDTSAPHATRRGELLSAPDLCGTCHEVTGPALFVEPTFTEHVRSPSFADGEHCRDCHMPERAPAPIAAGAERSRPRRDHGFVGIDPPWGADAMEAAAAAGATRDLLARALRVEVVVEAGAAWVSITNVARGHDVPTGLSLARDFWMDLELRDRDGRLVAIEPRVIELGDRPARAGVPVALPTDADGIERRRLAPDETRTIVRALPGAVVRVEAVLRARAFREDLLDELGLAARSSEVPTHEVARASARVAP